MYIPISLLRRHVRESNLIEQIRQRSGVALVSSHMNAAVQVARQAPRGVMLDPVWMHGLISRGTCMESFGGKLRTCDVYVGKHDMPRWEEVPRLLDAWYGLVWGCEKYKSASIKERARIARQLHDLFLCIHPFQDGNGRTSRLVLNMLRLRYNLPWLIIENKKKGSYYRQIEWTQENLFSPHYPDVFPKDRMLT